jgi:hypothetical protein
MNDIPVNQRRPESRQDTKLGLHEASDFVGFNDDIIV